MTLVTSNRIFSATLLLAVLMISACATSPRPAPAPVPAPPPARVVPAAGYTAVEHDILHLINVDRRKNKLDTLVWNEALDRAAKIQAVQMASLKTMAHTLPGAEHPTFLDRIKFVGYYYGRVEENVAYGYRDAEAVVKGWMESSGHR